MWGDYMSSRNVLPFKRSEKKTKLQPDPRFFEIESPSTPISPSSDVIDLSERRLAMINQERREVKRTILSEFIGAWVVIPGHGLQKCTLYDISDSGIAFDVDLNYGLFEVSEKVPVRIYLNQFSYFAFESTIENRREVENQSSIRYGASFKATGENGEALYHFVRFLESISAHLLTDSGDKIVTQVHKG